MSYGAVALLIAAQASLGTISPLVTAEGEHLFTFVIQPDSPKDITLEDWINDRLSRALAAQRWCLDGWEITSQQESSGYLVIEGRCR